MSNCQHDLAERETACADGMCPICLSAELERQRQVLADAVKAIGALHQQRWDLEQQVEALLERWDAYPQNYDPDEIRRAIAIAQAVEDCASVSMEYGEIMRRADELLEGKK